MGQLRYFQEAAAQTLTITEIISLTRGASESRIDRIRIRRDAQIPHRVAGACLARRHPENAAVEPHFVQIEDAIEPPARRQGARALDEIQLQIDVEHFERQLVAVVRGGARAVETAMAQQHAGVIGLGDDAVLGGLGRKEVRLAFANESILPSRIGGLIPPAATPRTTSSERRRGVRQ